MEKLSFQATLPPIQSAIKIGQDSARIQLDIPAIELHKAINLAFLQGKVLNVTIEVDYDA